MAIFYFANPSTPEVREVMASGGLGCIITPAQGKKPPAGAVWCADNGAFTKGYPGDMGFLAFLARLRYAADHCWFAVAPDVVCDAKATLERSEPFLPIIRAMGFPVALAAQNGLEDLEVPWDEFDVLFLGGDTEWKLGPAARDLTAQALALGKGVHMGRVNSHKRLRYADYIGCTSADGTYLAWGPDINLPKALGWQRAVHTQGVLWVPESDPARRTA